jgi:c-di-GMP-binding flagellar brake protein YcgR
MSESTRRPEAESDSADRRRYFRVQARLPVRCRAVAPGEFDALRAELEMPRAQYEGLEPMLAEHLAWLELKLDRVLANLEGAPSPTPVESHDVWISGAGLRFTAKEGLADPQASVLLEILLPSSPPRFVRTIGRVVTRNDIDPTRGDLAIEFRILHPDDREAIVHFTHEIERSELRRRAERE